MEVIQMNLSRKQSIFSELFSTFSQSALNLEHFQKKMTLIASVFPKLLTSKDVVGKTSKSSRFRGTLDTRHGERAKTLIRSEP